MELAMTSLECGRAWRFWFEVGCGFGCLEEGWEGEGEEVDWIRFRVGGDFWVGGVGGGDVDDDDESASIW